MSVKDPIGPEGADDTLVDDVMKFSDDVTGLLCDVTLCCMILLGTIL